MNEYKKCINISIHKHVCLKCFASATQNCTICPTPPMWAHLKCGRYRPTDPGLLMGNTILQTKLVGGFKHAEFSISYTGCHPSHWRTPSFSKMVKTTKQISYNLRTWIFNLCFILGWLKPICLPFLICKPLICVWDIYIYTPSPHVSHFHG